MDTLLPPDALQFAVVRERGDTMFKMVSVGLQNFGEKINHKAFRYWGSQQSRLIKREPVNDVTGQRQENYLINEIGESQTIDNTATLERCSLAAQIFEN